MRDVVAVTSRHCILSWVHLLTAPLVWYTHEDGDSDIYRIEQKKGTISPSVTTCTRAHADFGLQQNCRIPFIKFPIKIPKFKIPKFPENSRVNSKIPKIPVQNFQTVTAPTSAHFLPLLSTVWTLVVVMMTMTTMIAWVVSAIHLIWIHVRVQA